ncbi:hypothetical protein OCU04_006825 [Sclerotinia nivalis]|uniref:Uncharacterized protein n=1 Tax=Sclerotinia nivalis TaxID=352851 RepID=A0A9X0AKK4_9HELO|nr:hypothetical protein OCU04_006825 [Sclerotinia nivalis]
MELIYLKPLSFIIVLSVFIMGSGTALTLLGYYVVFFVIGGVFMLIGGAIMFSGFTVLLAVGAGLTTQIGYSVASAKVSPEKVAAAIGFINIAQIGGLVIALDISGTVFQNVAFIRLSEIISPLGFSASDIHDAVAGSQSSLFANLPKDVRGVAIEAIVQSISKTYALVMTGGAMCLVTGMLLKRERLFVNNVVAGA